MGNSNQKNGLLYSEGDFEAFDRIFYEGESRNGGDGLLLCSKERQEIIRVNTESKMPEKLNLETEEYDRMLYYDRKFFFINRELLTMDIFFLTKKGQSYHKKSFRFHNKDLKLKGNFSFIVWKYQEYGILYRCLLGPFENHKYIYFDLPERYFDANMETVRTIGKIFNIRLCQEDEGMFGRLRDIVCAMDEDTKSILCFDKNYQNFYEYKEFSQGESGYLTLVSKMGLEKNGINQMYFYYPYDYFTLKEKNMLGTLTRDMGYKGKPDDFMRNRYREVLLCMKNGTLYKLHVMSELPLANTNFVWMTSKISLEEDDLIDIAVNRQNGEIYCLGREGIKILPNSGFAHPDFGRLAPQQRKGSVFEKAEENS